MAGKASYGFQQLGHPIVEDDPDLVLTFGSSTHWNEIKDLSGKKVLSCHGVDWWRNFESPNNEKIKSVWDNADLVVYQSEFAKHMTEKAFGQKDGPIIWNASISNFPEKFIKWNLREEIKVVCTSIWRPWKRLHEIERLIRLVAQQGQKIKLFVVGKDSVYKTASFDLPLIGENYEIVYCGLMNHQQMAELYHQCHIGLHLSFNDFSPATVTEMMAMGLPMIVTNSGGSKDVIQHAGIVLDTDPFVDYPFNIMREDVLPKVDDQKFLDGFWKLMNNLEEYQIKNKEWVLKEANITRQMEKLLKICQ